MFLPSQACLDIVMFNGNDFGLRTAEAVLVLSSASANLPCSFQRASKWQARVANPRGLGTCTCIMINKA